MAFETQAFKAVRLDKDGRMLSVYHEWMPDWMKVEYVIGNMARPPVGYLYAADSFSGAWCSTPSNRPGLVILKGIALVVFQEYAVEVPSSFERHTKDTLDLKWQKAISSGALKPATHKSPWFMCEWFEPREVRHVVS